MRTKFTRIEFDPIDLKFREGTPFRYLSFQDAQQGSLWQRRLETMRARRGLPLRISTYGILFRGHSGTEDLAEAARLADQLGMALKERLADTGLPGLVSAVKALGSGQAATGTPDADLRMVLNVVRVIAMAAPQAVAERAADPHGVRWRLRPDMSPLLRASVRRRPDAGSFRRREA